MFVYYIHICTLTRGDDDRTGSPISLALTTTVYRDVASRFNSLLTVKFAIPVKLTGTITKGSTHIQ